MTVVLDCYQQIYCATATALNCKCGISASIGWMRKPVTRLRW